MTYQPVIPAGGNLGWAFLGRTRDAQQYAFNRSADVSRQIGYFRDNIAKVRTAEDLVSDRRLLTVALGAFGLDDDINNRFFVKKVLDEGILDDKSFANKLADKRYFALAKAFGFDLSPPNTVLSDFPDKIAARFQTRQFEVAVGEQDDNLRLALSLERDLAELAEKGMSEDGAWFTILGTPPLRQVFEKAFGLPPQTSAIDIDRQLEIFRGKSLKYFGLSDPADFADQEHREGLVRRFLLRADLDAAAQTTIRGSVALSLLSSQAPFGGS